jgi:hypothetical protein
MKRALTIAALFLLRPVLRITVWALGWLYALALLFFWFEDYLDRPEAP